MKSLVYLLAWRFLKGARHEKAVSTMIIVSFCAIAVGVFSLALVVSIMSGFERATHEQMQNIHPQLIIRSGSRPLNVKKFAELFAKEFPGVIAYAPTTTQNVLLQTTEQPSIDQALIIKAVDPHKEIAVTALGSKITQPRNKTLEKLLIDDHIMVGEKLARQLNLAPNQEVTLHFAVSTNRGKMCFEQERAHIAGTFLTGIEEFDTQLILCSFDFFNTLFPSSGATEIGLKLAPSVDESKIKEDLRTRTNLDVYSWKDLYPALVSALKLEKYVMFFLLALVTLVACMNIVSLMFMQIIRKRGTIAILLALGSSAKSIKKIFYCMGLLLTFFASTFGLLFAYFIGFLLQKYPFITLPDVYYVSQLPVSLEPMNFLIIFVLTHILSFIALRIAIRNIKTISITNILRFEA